MVFLFSFSFSALLYGLPAFVCAAPWFHDKLLPLRNLFARRTPASNYDLRPTLQVNRPHWISSVGFSFNLKLEVSCVRFLHQPFLPYLLLSFGFFCCARNSCLNLIKRLAECATQFRLIVLKLWVQGRNYENCKSNETFFRTERCRCWKRGRRGEM